MENHQSRVGDKDLQIYIVNSLHQMRDTLLNLSEAMEALLFAMDPTITQNAKKSTDEIFKKIRGES
jgi:hypothetical protein